MNIFPVPSDGEITIQIENPGNHCELVIYPFNRKTISFMEWRMSMGLLAIEDELLIIY